jgi:hypothetical protein
MFCIYCGLRAESGIYHYECYVQNTINSSDATNVPSLYLPNTHTPVAESSSSTHSRKRKECEKDSEKDTSKHDSKRYKQHPPAKKSMHMLSYSKIENMYIYFLNYRDICSQYYADMKKCMALFKWGTRSYMTFEDIVNHTQKSRQPFWFLLHWDYLQLQEFQTSTQKNQYHFLKYVFHLIATGKVPDPFNGYYIPPKLLKNNKLNIVINPKDI